MYTLLQDKHNSTPKRPVPESKSQNTSSTNKETSRPFRPERGYEVTGIVGSSDEDREDTPPRRDRTYRTTQNEPGGTS